MDQPFFGRVLASDASMGGLGVCASRRCFASAAVEELLASFPARPPALSVDFDEGASASTSGSESSGSSGGEGFARGRDDGTSAPSEGAEDPPPFVLPGPLASPAAWSTIISAPRNWSRLEHINILEMRAVSARGSPLGSLLPAPCAPNSRVLLLSDSIATVCVFCLLKGRRSTSPALHRILRPLAALLHCCHRGSLWSHAAAGCLAPRILQMARRAISDGWFLLPEAFAPSTRKSTRRALAVADFLRWCSVNHESAPSLSFRLQSWTSDLFSRFYSCPL